MGAGVRSVAAAGWINDGSPSPGMRTTVPLPGRGWYRHAAEGVGPKDDGAAGDPRVKPRLELCLLAFHRMRRRARMAALADALETVAGSIPGGGATSRVARSHAAFLCAHCVRNFRETPRWLVARVQRTMRGEDEKKPNANAARGVDALLEVPSSIPGAAAAVHENSGTSRRGRGRGRRLELGAETIAAVREAALVLAEAPVEPEDRLTVRPSGPGPGRRVGAYAKRAAWELLVALQDEGFDEGTAGVKGEPGTLGFLWSCSRACRAVLDDANDDSSSSSRRSVPPQLVEATVAVSTSLARGVGEDEETTRAAMTCAAADAACRAASLRAIRSIQSILDSPTAKDRTSWRRDPRSRDGRRGGRRAGVGDPRGAVRGAVAGDAEVDGRRAEQSARARRDASRDFDARRGVAVRQDERRAEPDSSRSAADVAAVTNADGSWEIIRREALSRGADAGGSRKVRG